MDKHYWKEAYKDSWQAASKKEEAIKLLIEKETGYSVEIVGLGAGTDGYITGSASDNKMNKGDADLNITEIDAYIEVTGPNIPMALERPLWFRPDKFANTAQKLKNGIGKKHFVIHVLDERGTGQKIIRTIDLNAEFFSRLDGHEFAIVNPIIRGRRETYVEIPYNDSSVMPFDQFIENLKHLK